jgi:hypothetical protein
MVQDGQLQLLQASAGVDAQLFRQVLAGSLVDGQGVGLAAAARSGAWDTNASNSPTNL